jgi:thiol-disulfide isomerase/thioredoxin
MKAVFLLIPLLVAGLARGADFYLPDLDGNYHHLADHRGKWVVINYWATWCPPCLEEIPELAVFHEKYKGKVEVLGINWEHASESKLREFVNANLIDYPVLRSRPDKPVPIGKVIGLPTTVIVGPDGEVKRVHVGAVTRQQLERYTLPQSMHPKRR